jgi:predicted acyltransferase
MSRMPSAQVSAPPIERAYVGRRALALDALRGLFLLLMTFGFSVIEGIYPAWMYHRQEPPPAHAWVEIAGLTWRDLTYPAFLFTMAAALPITFGLRIARGAGLRALAWAALRRWFLLFFFALMVAHSSGYWIHEYSPLSRSLSLTGFCLLALIFTRPRADWNPRFASALRGFGWLLSVAYLALSPWLYDASFDLARHDEILAELGFASFAGVCIWYATRRDRMLRLAILAGIAALSLSAQVDSWIADLWWASPVPWLFEGSFVEILIVVLPGTLAGDWIVEWMCAAASSAPARWSRVRCAALAGLGGCFGPVLVVGLYQRWVLATALVVLALCGVALALVREPSSDTERLVRDLCRSGALWLVLGMLLEPLEGGIKKVPGTLAYYFTTLGHTLMLLTSLFALSELLGKKAWVRTLVEIGQNPLVGYVLFTLCLEQLVDLIPGMDEILSGSPAQLLVRSAIYVVAFVLIVRELTRREIFWRA